MRPTEFPAPVQIGAFSYEVRAFRPDDAVEDDRFGDQCSRTLEIRIADAPASRQLHVLLHELLHAAWDAHGYQYTARKMGEEEIVEFASAAMASIIVRNPHLHDTIRLLAEGNPFMKGLPHA